MKKLITKMLSMTLALAMCLSVTALAIDAKPETVPSNDRAFYNYIHRDYIWYTDTPNDNMPGLLWYTVAVTEPDSKTTEFMNHMDKDKYIKSTMDKTHGNILSTWKYLNENYCTSIANVWYGAMKYGYEYDGNYTTQTVNWHKESIIAANRYLQSVDTYVNDGFVYLYENYGENLALRYVKSFISRSKGYDQNDRIDIKNMPGSMKTNSRCLTAQEWVVEKTKAALNSSDGEAGGLAYADPDLIPLKDRNLNADGTPKAIDPNKPVKTTTTILVNNKPVTLETMSMPQITIGRNADGTLAYHEFSPNMSEYAKDANGNLIYMQVPYFKLSDLAAATGFEYHLMNPDNNSGICIHSDRGLAATGSGANDGNGSCGVINIGWTGDTYAVSRGYNRRPYDIRTCRTQGKVVPIFANDRIQHFNTVIDEMDVYGNGGGIYFDIYEISIAMGFEVDWDGTGDTISITSNIHTNRNATSTRDCGDQGGMLSREERYNQRMEALK